MKQAVAAILERAKQEDYENMLDVPKERFRKLCSEPCFDIKKVGKRLRLNNRGTQVLNAHLALDHVLTVFLNDQFISAKKVRTDRMSFNQKADLLYSLGKLPQENHYWAKKVNSLRNKLAHELDFKVPDENVAEFVEHFKDVDGEGLVDRLQFAHSLFLIVLYVEKDRTQQLSFDVDRHLSMLNARKVLAEIAPSEGSSV